MDSDVANELPVTLKLHIGWFNHIVMQAVHNGMPPVSYPNGMLSYRSSGGVSYHITKTLYPEGTWHACVPWWPVRCHQFKLQISMGIGVINVYCFNCRKRNLNVMRLNAIMELRSLVSPPTAEWTVHCQSIPDSKVHGANMRPTWVLSARDGPMLAPWALLSGWLLDFILSTLCALPSHVCPSGPIRWPGILHRHV